MVVVLVVSSGAAWESPALTLLQDAPDVVVLKRCVDVDDLLAAATALQADVAVVGLDAAGLDLAAVDHLHAHGVRPVAITPAGAGSEPVRLHAARVGIGSLVPEDDLGPLVEAVTGAGDPAGADGPPDPAVRPAGAQAGELAGPEEPSDPTGRPPGRVVAVWGPGGAPGRTTVAAAVAAELARRRLRTVLVDADPYGGAVAQQLGIMDEVSGLLSAARLAVGGQLAERLGSVQRGVDSHLSVVTGLPRADRWVEVRPGALEHLLEVASAQAHVVVDTGFCLEDDASTDLGSRPGRNQLTLGALDVADEVLVVGGADPVGLSRLARALVDLRDRTGGAPVRVVVNRMRPTLGWSEKDVAGMVSGFTRLSGLHFLPEDRAALDRALVAGRTLVEVGDSALARAVAALVDDLVPASCPAPNDAGRFRLRRGGRARSR